MNDFCLSCLSNKSWSRRIFSHQVCYPAELGSINIVMISLVCLIVSTVSTVSSVSAAQDSPFESTQTAAPREPAIPPPNTQTQAPARQTGEEVEIPPPENLMLDTSDGVVLHCTYFGAPPDPESGSGKTTLCFILLHDWEGSRQDLLPFGQYLQQMGSAVIVPDLRGHGESITVAGSTATLDYKKFRKNEMASVPQDIERCKKFLVQQNNEGKLNIDMLNIVAVGETAVLAIKWTIADWFAFPPVQGGIKQGQDVKSLILISPRKKMNGLNVNTDIKHPLFAGKGSPNLPTLVVWSANDEEAAKDGSSIFEIMQRGRPDVNDIADPSERAKQTTLYQAVMPRTGASGTDLIRDDPVNGLWAYVVQFVGSQIYTQRESFPWQSRERD